MTIGPDSEILKDDNPGPSAPSEPSKPSEPSRAAGSAFNDVSETGRAIAKGIAAAETPNLVGMGLVAASALNRSDLVAQGENYGTKGKTDVASVLSAPYTADRVIEGATSGRGVPVKEGGQMAVQYTPLSNSSQSGASPKGFGVFRDVAVAELDPAREIEDPRTQERADKSQLANDVVYSARDMGIDVSHGVTNYGAPGFADKAGASGAVTFGGRGEAQAYGGPHFGGGSPGQFASAFAAAAALTGFSIPSGWFQSDVAPYTTADQINAQAHGMQTAGDRGDGAGRGRRISWPDL
jgi:hypothetical protein